MGRIYKRGQVWYCDYIDANGNRVRKNTKMKDKQLANKVLHLWEGDQRQIEVGLKQATRAGDLIESLLFQFIAAKQTARTSKDHIDRTIQLVRAVCSFNGWKLLGDISADGVNKFGQHLIEQEGQAARTIASMITAMRTFCRWCVRTRALLADPTASVAKPSIQSDRRIERRMLSPEEWAWIKTTLKVENVRNGQSSDERLLMYRLAIETGLRSNELRSLKCSSLVLNGSEPHVIAKAKITKNSELAKQYVSDQLAADLRSHIKGKRPGSAVFNVVSRLEMARTLRSDLDDARTLWLASPDGKHGDDSDFLSSPDSQGEVIDFHSLRHTCGAWLVQQGVTLAEVKEIMRHSTITLTIDCYGHLAKDARSKSRSVLGSMLG
jgi:integrase